MGGFWFQLDGELKPHFMAMAITLWFLISLDIYFPPLVRFPQLFAVVLLCNRNFVVCDPGTKINTILRPTFVSLLCYHNTGYGSPKVCVPDPPVGVYCFSGLWFKYCNNYTWANTKFIFIFQGYISTSFNHWGLRNHSQTASAGAVF